MGGLKRGGWLAAPSNSALSHPSTPHTLRSESGKLVHRLFAHIREMVEDEDSLVVLLIDEVESLTAARKAAVAGSEPSDAVRVVNAVLTAIDSFRTRKNVRGWSVVGLWREGVKGEGVEARGACCRGLAHFSGSRHGVVAGTLLPFCFRTGAAADN